jgi:hypothetical protein
MKNYRLPNGALTKNPNTYAEAWESMGSKLANFLGPEWNCVSYNPDFHLIRKRKLQMGLYGWEGRVDWKSPDDNEAWTQVDSIDISVTLAYEFISRLFH